ncbi:hypothetical protein Tco_0133504 [Tanacetum coccineum]
MILLLPSTIVEEFDSLCGRNYQTKGRVKKISDRLLKKGLFLHRFNGILESFTKEELFIHLKLLPNDESILKEEVHKETLKSYLNPLFEDDEEIISIEVSRQISPKVNSKPSIESLPKDDFDNDDDLFEMDSNNDEWKRILYGEDFERMDSDSDKTKDFDKSSSNVFKSLSDEFEPGGSSYVEGNDLVCYEDFHVSDALFSTINEDKVFNPGILVDKNSKVHEPNVLPTLPTRSSEMMLDFDLENFQVEPKNDILNPKVLVFDPGIFDNVLTRKSSLTLKIFDPPSIVIND